jgi:HEXXH motif-containing protein
VAVSSDGAEAILTLALGGCQAQITFIRSGPQWIPGSESRLTLLSEAGTCDIPVLLLPQAAAGEPLAATVPPFRQTITPDITSAWQDALSLLHRYAPAYEAWAQRVVRQIAVVEATPGVVHSGSYRERHGFIHASAHTSAISMAEMLVHEASHQYFYLLSCIGPVDDGTDTAEYYSPLVQRKRPLDRMLFAFHACANIRHFYRLCEANGLRDLQYCRENEPIVARQLEQLDAPLRDNGALTSIGRTIYHTLQEVVT